MPRPAFGRGDSMSIISEKGAGMAIKDVLPRLRRERGLTQEGLAKKLFITRQAVSRWETGRSHRQPIGAKTAGMSPKSARVSIPHTANATTSPQGRGPKAPRWVP